MVVRLELKIRIDTITSVCRSEVEVVWQDGSVERGVPSAELYPIHHLDDHEFFPGDFVTEAKDGFHPHSYGVVQVGTQSMPST